MEFDANSSQPTYQCDYIKRGKVHPKMLIIDIAEMFPFNKRLNKKNCESKGNHIINRTISCYGRPGKLFVYIHIQPERSDHDTQAVKENEIEKEIKIAIANQR